jgi:hypothetical protein
MNQTGYIVYDTEGYLPIGQHIDWEGPSPQNLWPVSPGGDGEYTVRYDLVLAGILENIAPHINGTIRFRPDGKGGYGAIGVRDGFPWAEAYYWDGQGNVQTIFQRPALPNSTDPSENLNAIENPIPCWNLLYHGRDIVANKFIVQSIRKSYPQIDAFASP